MHCPACNIKMKVVTVQAHYGERVFINQCASCGGIWFDSNELYRISPAEADTIDTVDVGKIKSSKDITNEPLACPHDGQKLIVFYDVNFPSNLIVELCPACNGFWFNHGEFKKLKEYQAEKINNIRQEKQILDPKLEEQINKLLSMQSSENTYSSLGKIAKFLSSPVQSGQVDIGDGAFVASGADLAGSVLTAVLRGIVGRT